MMKTSLSMLALASLCFAPLASAATLKNLDTSPHRVVIVEGDARQELTIESQQELSGLCQVSCSLYVGNDPEPYDVAAKDRMEIERGEVFYQAEPEQPQPKQ